MGTDKKTSSLDLLPYADLQTYLSTLMLALDSTSFVEQKRIPLFQILSTEAVAEGSQVDYVAMTPKSFAASYATYTRLGIVRYATEADITAKEESRVIGATTFKFAVEDHTKEVLNLIDANKATYIHSFTGAETINPDLHFNRIGLSMLIGGKLTAVNSGLNFSTSIIVYFKNIDLPKFDQSACVIAFIGGKNISCGGSWYDNGTYATLAIYAPTGVVFSGSTDFYISFQYITA